MKKFICALLCGLLILTVGCAKKSDTEKISDTKSGEVFTPSKITVSALNDITGCALTGFVQLNDHSKLKGNYIVSLYADDNKFLNDKDMGYGLAFLSVSAGTNFCRNEESKSMLALVSTNITAYSKTKLNSISDFEGKKVAVLGNLDVKENLNIMLKKADVTCDIENTDDRYHFDSKIDDGNFDIVVALYPYASEIEVKNTEFKYNLSLNSEWERLKIDGKPYTHSIVCHRGLPLADPKTCDLFFEELQNSITDMNNSKPDVVKNILERGLNSCEDTALKTCKNNGLVIENYKNTKTLLTKYANIRCDNLKIDKINY